MSKCKKCGEAIIFVDRYPWFTEGDKREWDIMEPNGFDKHYCTIPQPKFVPNDTVQVVYKGHEYLYRIESILENKRYNVTRIKFGNSRVFYNNEVAKSIQYIDKFGNKINLDNYKLLYQ